MTDRRNPLDSYSVAAAMRDRILNYWEMRGARNVTAEVIRDFVKPETQGGGHYSVRTNLVNGLPPEDLEHVDIAVIRKRRWGWEK
ncbi:hypothetical protein [uncultured Cohaesibacter sp.]|uniref:hypothetical protein n=1 Tax=uncultured Cohaesibacter sp. TaxID=1002546 RepID=UPI0029C60AD1|nr:hypothetical protein [uncultured Cohaesibacter sp.]